MDYQQREGRIYLWGRKTYRVAEQGHTFVISFVTMLDGGRRGSKQENLLGDSGYWKYLKLNILTI